MKASLETSALFLSTTLELKNFVSPDLKFHCFLLPNFRSKDSSRSFSDLETTGPFQSMFISASKADCFAFLSGSSGKYPAYPETFQAIRKFSGSSGKYPAYLETFQAIRKISGQSGKYPDYLEIFQRVRKLPSAILRVTRKNFPDAQKLSGWQCHPATQVFGPLPRVVLN